MEESSPRYTDRVTCAPLHLATWWIASTLALGACGGKASTDAPESDGGSDAMFAADGPTVAAPRPIAPLSTATTTSQRPTFRWALAAGTDGAQVDICRDRACASVVTTFVASGARGAPSSALAAGVYFWRLHGAVNGAVGSDVSAVWEIAIGARSAPVDTSWGGGPDVNGDGYTASRRRRRLRARDGRCPERSTSTSAARTVLPRHRASTLAAPTEMDEWFPTGSSGGQRR